MQIQPVINSVQNKNARQHKTVTKHDSDEAVQQGTATTSQKRHHKDVAQHDETPQTKHRKGCGTFEKTAHSPQYASIYGHVQAI
jgi:hypothetical protein